MEKKFICTCGTLNSPCVVHKEKYKQISKEDIKIFNLKEEIKRKLTAEALKTTKSF